MNSISYLISSYVLVTCSIFTRIQGAADANSSSDCQFTDSHDVVYCRVLTWYPDLLEDQQINKSAVAHLEIVFKENSTQLTRKHLEGLDNLKSLVVVGRCANNPKMNWCKQPVGLETIDRDAFEATPQLLNLRLKIHPTEDLGAISQLKQLNFLDLQWMRSVRDFNASLFDNMRGTLKGLLLWYIPVQLITSDHFQNMTNLRTLEINTANLLIIKTRGISNLPNLTSLMISFYSRRRRLILQENAIANLTKLEHVSISLIHQVGGPLNKACTGEFNVVSLHMKLASVTFFDHCPQILYCLKCGLDPKRFPQVITLTRPIPALRKRGFRIFPTSDVIPAFNTTSIVIHHSNFPYPFEMFSQMPLLKRFIIELSNTHKHIRHRRIARLRDNPFALLPNRTQLNEFRISLRHCDCQLFKIINWFRSNRRYDSEKSVEDVLKIDCLIVDGICSDEEKGKYRLFFKLLNISLFEEKIKPFCGVSSGKNNPIQRQVSSSECRCIHLESCSSATSASTVLPMVGLIVLIVSTILFALVLR